MEIVLACLLVGSFGIGLAWDELKESKGVWSTPYKWFVVLVFWLCIISFGAAGMTAATIIGLLFTVFLATAAILLLGICGSLCIVGWVANRIMRV